MNWWIKIIRKSIFGNAWESKRIKKKEKNLDSLIKDLEIYKASKEVSEKEYNIYNREQKKKR